MCGPGRGCRAESSPHVAKGLGSLVVRVVSAAVPFCTVAIAESSLRVARGVSSLVVQTVSATVRAHAVAIA
eukprot:10389497-Lingulodinium_polyedra.AAC.1